MMSSIDPGTIVDRRYRIIEELGRGGMGRVYRAEHLGLRIQVALKVLDAPLSDPLAARLDREARAAARLDHPGCVRVLDQGRVDGRCYLAMEQLEGPSLADDMDRRGALPVAEAVDATRQIVDALAHAHKHGVLHRDIKPENAVYRRTDETRRLVLIDFGLARIHDEAPLTAAGMCAGSPSYIAPERLFGERYDGRADLYAVGVALYEMLTGKRPYSGSSPLAIVRGLRAGPPVAARTLRRDIDPALNRLVMRLLAHDPDRRPPRAEDLLDELASVPATPEAQTPSAAAPREPEPSSTALMLELQGLRQPVRGRLRRWWHALFGRPGHARALPTMEAHIARPASR